MASSGVNLNPPYLDIIKKQDMCQTEQQKKIHNPMLEGFINLQIKNIYPEAKIS